MDTIESLTTNNQALRDAMGIKSRALLQEQRKAELSAEEAERLRRVIETTITDLRDTEPGEIPFHDAHTSLADWLAVQVAPRRQCPLLSLMAGEQPVLPEAV